MKNRNPWKIHKGAHDIANDAPVKKFLVGSVKFTWKYINALKNSELLQKGKYCVWQFAYFDDVGEIVVDYSSVDLQS